MCFNTLITNLAVNRWSGGPSAKQKLNWCPVGEYMGLWDDFPLRYRVDDDREVEFKTVQDAEKLQLIKDSVV
jgi:hypothetical protein